MEQLEQTQQELHETTVQLNFPSLKMEVFGGPSQHFARHNMADLTAKEGTQETIVNLFGMLGATFVFMMLSMDCIQYSRASFGWAILRS